MKYVTHAESETIALGKRLSRHARPGMTFLLHGDLACGKTTFTKGIAQGLGITEIVNSPTFTILKIYEKGRFPLYHIDAYRLENNDYDLGLDENSEEVLTVIEWPQYYPELPSEHLDIDFRYIDDDTREITFRPQGRIYEDLLKELSLC